MEDLVASHSILHLEGASGCGVDADRTAEWSFHTS